MKTPVWLAQYVGDGVERPVNVGVLFSHRGQIHGVFLGFDEVDPDPREREPNAEALQKAGADTPGGHRNWVFYWMTMLRSGRAVDEFIDSHTNQYRLVRGETREFGAGLSLGDVAGALRSEFITHMSPVDEAMYEEDASEGDDEIATLIEQGCWWVEGHRPHLEVFARFVLRGGELDSELKPLAVRYSWLVPTLRGLHDALGRLDERPSSSRIGAALEMAFDASRFVTDAAVEDALGRLVVSVFNKPEVSNRVHFRVLVGVLCSLTGAVLMRIQEAEYMDALRILSRAPFTNHNYTEWTIRTLRRGDDSHFEEAVVVLLDLLSESSEARDEPSAL